MKTTLINNDGTATPVKSNIEWSPPPDAPKRSLKLRTAIDLRTEDVTRLNEIAAVHGCTARAGSTYGNPSWRALVKDIALGKLIVSKP